MIYLDDSAEYAAHMDKIFSNLDIPPADENDEDSEPDDTYTR